MKKLRLLFYGLMIALALPVAAQAKTLYWISHGGPADPVWTYFLAGAKQWAEDTGQTVKTSFHNGDVPSQQEAIRAAIAAKADAIVTTSPDPGSLIEIVKEAKAANIPLINFNTPDPSAHFQAYVGTDLIGLGDLATGSIKRVFDQVGVKPGEIPVVGWGNSLDTTGEVKEGYVNAAQWQDPQATSYVALSLALMATDGIPPKFNVITGALYEKDSAKIYADVMSA